MSMHKNLRGQDLHAPTNELVENQSGGALLGMRVVRLDGMGTVYPKVVAADPANYINFGIVNYDIPAGKVGYVCCFGFMFEVDTSSWVVGTNLYSDASGNLTDQVNAGIVAYVIKQDAQFGVLYVVAEQANDVNSVSWRLQGNNGLNELVSFLGTTDSVDLRIRTNNQLRAIFDKQGRFALGPDLVTPLNHFHQKSHTGYSGSGFRQETFSLTTSSAVNQVAFSIPIAQNSTVKVEFNTVARISDGSGRAGFKRIGLFFRESSNVQIERFWQTEFTEKSNASFNVSYTMGVNEVTIYVKSATAIDTYWTGHVKIESVSTDL